MNIEKKYYEKQKTIQLPYAVFLPEDYKDNNENEWSVILYLHGAGERGDDPDLMTQSGTGLFYYIEKNRDFPFVVLAPQCPVNDVWDMHYAEIMEMLDNVLDLYRIDKKRVYLTGISMGGCGTWHFTYFNPERFAAIAPVCGCAANPNSAKRLVNVPIWTFHGKNDKAVPFEETEKLVTVLKEHNGNIRFSEYPHNGHEVCTLAYLNKELYSWFLKHKLE